MEREDRQLKYFTVTMVALIVILNIIYYLLIGRRMGKLVANILMLTPTIAVVVAKLTTKGDEKLPIVFYVSYLLAALAYAVLLILNLIGRIKIIETINLMGYVMIAHSVLAIAGSGDEVREANGLGMGSNFVTGAIWVGASILLIILMNGSFSFSNLQGSLWSVLSVFPFHFFNLFSSVGLLLGQEYGWRYFLQGELIERFGKEKGLSLLGLFWAGFTLLIDLLIGVKLSPLYIVTKLLIGIVVSIIMSMIYMKKKNIWQMVLINHLTATITGGMFLNLSVGVLIGIIILSLIVWFALLYSIKKS